MITVSNVNLSKNLLMLENIFRISDFMEEFGYDGRKFKVAVKNIYCIYNNRFVGALNNNNNNDSR